MNLPNRKFPFFNPILDLIFILYHISCENGPTEKKLTKIVIEDAEEGNICSPKRSKILNTIDWTSLARSKIEYRKFQIAHRKLKHSITNYITHTANTSIII